MAWVKGRVASRVRLTYKKHGSGHGLTHFCFGPKNQVQVEYFSDWIGLSQKILTRFVMSNLHI